MHTLKIALLSGAALAFAFGVAPAAAQSQQPQQQPQAQQGGGSGGGGMTAPESTNRAQTGSTQEGSAKPDAEKKPGSTAETRGQTEKKAQDQTKPQGQTTQKDQPKQGQTQMQGQGQQDQTKQQGQTTQQQQGGKAQGKIEEKQVTTIKQYFATNKVRVDPVPRNSISVSIGFNVPSRVKLYPLPSAIVIDVPSSCPYHYFVWGNDIVVVDSCTRLVLAVIVDVA